MSAAQTTYGMLLTTVANKDDAKKLAEMLLKEKLVACVQVFPVESFYTWKGETANEAELLLLVKTKSSHFEEAIRAIKAIHPYETPEIVGTNFVAGFEAYFGWIDEVTK